MKYFLSLSALLFLATVLTTPEVYAKHHTKKSIHSPKEKAAGKKKKGIKKVKPQSSIQSPKKKNLAKKSHKKSSRVGSKTE